MAHKYEIPSFDSFESSSTQLNHLMANRVNHHNLIPHSSHCVTEGSNYLLNLMGKITKLLSPKHFKSIGKCRDRVELSFSFLHSRASINNLRSESVSQSGPPDRHILVKWPARDTWGGGAEAEAAATAWITIGHRYLLIIFDRSIDLRVTTAQPPPTTSQHFGR